MTTFVARVGTLPVRSSTFAVVTDAAVLDITNEGVLFDGDLDAGTVAAVRERMLSRDDDDYAARANLRALRDAAETAEFNAEGFAMLQAAAVEALTYWLGD